MIDTHCHLNDEKFDNCLENTITNFTTAGVNYAVCVGWDLNSSIKAKLISSKYANIYYSVGVHPDNIASYKEQEFENLIKNEVTKPSSKLVAVGEIGLDYFHNKENKTEQQNAFVSQIKLAKKYGLPIIIHCRDAYADTLNILKKEAPFNYGAVMHCYGGSLEYAKELLKLGLKLSFTGTVTFKNAKNVQQVVSNIPLSSFFLETDCPYLTPEPNRGKLNEPKYVVDILNFVSDLRNMPTKELEELTDKTAKQFFNIN